MNQHGAGYTVIRPHYFKGESTMVEQLNGIVIEVIYGQVLYNNRIVKLLYAETQEDLVAQAKAYINSHLTAERNPDLWQVRVRR
jgi:hypothetical protein